AGWSRCAAGPGWPGCRRFPPDVGDPAVGQGDGSAAGRAREAEVGTAQGGRSGRRCHQAERVTSPGRTCSMIRWLALRRAGVFRSGSLPGRGEVLVNLDLARWQFAFVTINHFFFVPVTIGLAFLTALLQTAWYRSKREEYLRLTRFFGVLLVINVAIGVVTGLVQEFQFGMNWSAYSRLVGNVFGAPLAMEGLGAFFLESVFLGLWLFGWDKLSRRVHLATIWA